MKIVITFTDCTIIKCILIGLLLTINFCGFIAIEQQQNILNDGSTIDCQNSTAHRVEVAFTTKIIQNEYIVAFNDYYKQTTRETYVRAVLNGSNVKNWKILPRNNPASDYPSDFDVIVLEEDENNSNGLEALESHPFVRSVTPQRMVHRTLKYIPLAKDEETHSHQQNIVNGNSEQDDAEHKLLQELFDKVSNFSVP